eukprot:7256559-Alexandrium_andersonii.AAC.1
MPEPEHMLPVRMWSRPECAITASMPFATLARSALGIWVTMFFANNGSVDTGDAKEPSITSRGGA